MNALNKNIRIVTVLLLQVAVVIQVNAQQAAVAEPVSQRMTLPSYLWEPTFYLWLVVAVIVAATFLTLSRSVNVLTGLLEDKRKESTQQVSKVEEYRERPNAWVSFVRSMTRSVPVEQERDVMLDHDYDGIRELDNQLPPWWKYGFYLTIVFAVVYLFGYHLSGTGKLQLEEYDQQMAEAEALKMEMMQRNAEFVTAENVTLLSDAALIAEGKGLFEKNCAACHKSDGGGNVGPNLTDDFWIHGGGIGNVFRTVTEGVPAKGMISWKSQLSPRQIQEVSSYILTLHGTNPPGAKEPQGDLWKESVVTADSVASDAVSIIKP
jgi:cytochrome c oxidase cbb3-type subunit 3